MPLRGPFALVPLLALAGAAAIPAQASLEDAVAAAESRGFRTGVVVRDLRTGAFVFRHRDGEAFLPASNQKLLTVAAALWALGPGYRFRTRFELRGGVLYCHAGGDPNWITGSQHDPELGFAAVAAALFRAGVQQVRGIHLASGRFTGPARPVAWPKEQFDKSYCAPTGGLVLEEGCFRARIEGGRPQPRVELVAPPVRVTFGGSLRTALKRRKTYSYWLAQSRQGFRAYGEFPADGDAVEVRGVCQDPEWVFELALRHALSRRGIRIDATAPAVDREIYTWESKLAEALPAILKESSNFHAEQVFRVLGAEKAGSGSFAGGRTAVRAELRKKLELPEALRIDDGSGMSRQNAVSPGFVCEVVMALCRGEHSKLFVANLAQGGVDGTLRKRLRGKDAGAALHAKTGTLDGVKSLSGIVRLADGEIRAFSILMNKRKGRSNAGANRLQDRMVEAIYHGRTE